jgi:hypothetical protein
MFVLYSPIPPFKILLKVVLYIGIAGEIARGFKTI